MEDLVFCSVTPFYEFGHWVAEFSGCNEDIDHFFEPRVFKNGEFCPTFKVDVTGKPVVIVANPEWDLSPQEISQRICLTAAAAKQNGAEQVVLVQSDLAYGRQDRYPWEDEKFQGQPNASIVQAQNFHANGIDRVLSMHLHSSKIYQFYGEVYMGLSGSELANRLRLDTLARRANKSSSDPDRLSEEERLAIEEKLEYKGREIIYSLDPNPILAHYLRFRSSLDIINDGENIVFIAPDKGAKVNIDRLRSLMFLPNSSVAYCDKIRDVPNDPAQVHVTLAGKSNNYTGIHGKILILADDIIDTGGTMIKTVESLKNDGGEGIPSAIYLCFTHAVLAAAEGKRRYDEVQHNIGKVDPTEIIMFDTHPYIKEMRIPKWKRLGTVIRSADYLGNAIKNSVLAGRLPKEIYTASSAQELDERYGEMYDFRRSKRHFLERKRK